MSETWLVCFSCCTEETPQPPRKRIDRSMIGLPQNFQHTGHIGSGDMATGFNIGTVQVQMKSKGGYSENSNDLHNYTPGGIPVGGASGNNL